MLFVINHYTYNITSSLSIGNCTQSKFQVIGMPLWGTFGQFDQLNGGNFPPLVVGPDIAHM